MFFLGRYETGFTREVMTCVDQQFGNPGPLRRGSGSASAMAVIAPSFLLSAELRTSWSGSGYLFSPRVAC